MANVSSLLPDVSFWHGKRVFLTGHSGFKGSWIALWLHSLGAKVCGYALPPQTSPNLYSVLDIPGYCAADYLADIRDYEQLAQVMQDFLPDLVIHMAAQPLVRRSYQEPLSTISTNIDGTAHVLEACRVVESLRGVLVITTDKCYKNKETPIPYIEDDELGGRDIYSASKACAEIITYAYRQSFFENGRNVRVVTARAGNVIGGGDWSDDRLLPDAARAFSEEKILTIRSPEAVRPWQHVTESLLGYLMLARAMLEGRQPLSHAYNFGPELSSAVPVKQVIDIFAANWYPEGVWQVESSPHWHEAKLLMLDSTRAKNELSWHPCFTLEEAVTHTVNWYRYFYEGCHNSELIKHMLALCEAITIKAALKQTTTENITGTQAC